MSQFNLGPVVDSFANATVSVARPNTDTYGAGGFANAQTFVITSSVKACVQPGPGKNLTKLPEGSYPADVIRVWTTFELQPRDRLVVDSGVFAITLGGRNFEVFDLDEWGDHGGYTMAYARALAGDEPRA